MRVPQSRTSRCHCRARQTTHPLRSYSIFIRFRQRESAPGMDAKGLDFVFSVVALFDRTARRLVKRPSDTLAIGDSAVCSLPARRRWSRSRLVRGSTRVGL